VGRGGVIFQPMELLPCCQLQDITPRKVISGAGTGSSCILAMISVCWFRSTGPGNIDESQGDSIRLIGFEAWVYNAHSA